MDTNTFHKINYGMYIVSSKARDQYSGLISNSVFQATAVPPKFGVCINNKNFTYQLIEKSRIFTISILEQGAPMRLIGHFGYKSGRNLDKFENIKYRLGQTGAPVIIQNCVGYIECKVTDEINVGTHTIFVGETIDAQIIKNEEPMTYSYYRQVKRGKSPEAAPTYVKEVNIAPEEKKMEKYRCIVCGYIYDPANGDADGGIPPGTSFEDLPDDWLCPLCGVGKDKFEVVSE